jgi:hypothetical protein
MSVWASYFGLAKRDANTRTCWDYTFQLTPEHPTAEEFERLKFSCDTLADEALARLNEIAPPSPPVRRRTTPPTAEKQTNSSPALPDFYAHAVSAEEDPSDLPAIFKSPQTDSDLPATPAARPKKRDLYAIVKEHAETDETLGTLWHQLTTVPDWVDWDQIARGQDVFYRYGGPCLTGLAFQSLIGGLVNAPTPFHSLCHSHCISRAPHGSSRH